MRARHTEVDKLFVVVYVCHPFGVRKSVRFPSIPDVQKAHMSPSRLRVGFHIVECAGKRPVCLGSGFVYAHFNKDVGGFIQKVFDIHFFPSAVSSNAVDKGGTIRIIEINFLEPRIDIGSLPVECYSSAGFDNTGALSSFAVHVPLVAMFGFPELYYPGT